MSFNKLMGIMFTIVFIIILYLIIIFALKIMYKDVKNGGRKKTLKKALGLEIIDAGQNKALKKGSIIPVRSTITLGRKEDNNLILTDQYASGHHAKVFIKNQKCIIEDLGSTNGTFVNGDRVIGKIELDIDDEVQIGSLVFRIIG